MWKCVLIEQFNFPTCTSCPATSAALFAVPVQTFLPLHIMMVILVKQFYFEVITPKVGPCTQLQSSV